MYLIDKQANRIKNLTKKTFSELKFRERDHLQEWLAHEPKVFGEELLIIQKEFNGFNETNERLDLLALDKDGNLVIIENKLDDTGRDLTWQALKYASYCSTLTKEQIKDIYQTFLDKQDLNERAEDKLSAFFNQEYEEITLNPGQTQRMIFVAAKFRKEVTSTVLWLMNYKLRIQCFKATPFELNDQLFLTLEQIIPTKDTEDFIISMADKTQEEINKQESRKSQSNLRFEFWTKILPILKGKTPIFQNSSPTNDHWLNSGAGISDVRYSMLVTKKYAGVQLDFAKSNKEVNKKLFDELINDKEKIEKAFGAPLIWARLDDNISSSICYKNENLNIFNEDDWNEILEFISKSIVKLEEVMRAPLKKVKEVLNSTDDKED